MRHISPEIFLDEWFGCLDLMSRLLWIGILTTCADDQGRFQHHIPSIRVKVFPFDTDITNEQIDSALAEFIKSHKLISYQFGVNGTSKYYLQVFNWWKYQKGAQWAAASRHPAPDGWIDRIRSHMVGSGTKPVTQNWDKTGGLRSDYAEPTKPQQSREDEDESKVEDELRKSQSPKEESSVSPNAAPSQTTDDRTRTLTDLCKLCGIPRKYHGAILADQTVIRDDILAELSRNYSRKGNNKGQVKQPGLITGMNLAKGERAPAEWYAQTAWTRHLPHGLSTKLGLANSETITDDENLVASDYAHSDNRGSAVEKKVAEFLKIGGGEDGR